MPPYDATVVARLDAAGAVLLGKTNMDEFAMGSSTENSAFGTTRNPWDLARVPGGSSGGSAAAVAARHVPRLRLGTDTGGSIRQPAALLRRRRPQAHLRPRVALRLVAFASSLDQVGPVRRATCEDAALLLEAIAGARSADATAVDAPVPDYRAALGRGVEGLQHRRPAEYFVDGHGSRGRARGARGDRARSSGWARAPSRSRCRTPSTRLAAYYLIATAEASLEPRALRRRAYGLRAPRRARPARHVQRDARGRASAPRSSAASCSAPTRSPPATTTPTTARRRRCAR